LNQSVLYKRTLFFVKVNNSDNSQMSLFPACRRMVTLSYGWKPVWQRFHTNSYRPTSNIRESDEIWNSDKDKGMNIYIII
uniref:Uncharacterized protein n=1 Tax=Gasterosteus aculeatus aculeatus TaxID=481459 RepID=A0AAQ4RBB3_GASAC